MVSKCSPVSAGVTALLVLSGGLSPLGVHARQPGQGVPAAYRQLAGRVTTWNAEDARVVMRTNVLVVKDAQRQMALKARGLDEHGVTGLERKRDLNNEAARLRREQVRLVQVRPGVHR